IAQPPGKPWAPVMLFDLGASTFDDASVLNTGWTCGFARPTIQASIDVCDKGFADRQSARVNLQHLIDAPTRGIHFHAKHAVRWTMIQAESAMDTGCIEIPGRTIGPRKVGFAN